ncbi:MAG TPA: ketoacyl-ACP synthase III [Candidatus Acidoferrum sp.]|jgi:3-oxoacyl-[acyl-carrier-protein] synthase-3|nr:ketoacyl-ACP synthase III [Candidatus Acidoferrum sp.]
MKAAIRAIEYYLPEKAVTTEQLSAEFPEWSVQKIDEKTGIQARHIAGEDECSSDLAVAAAQKLFASGVCAAHDIDYVLLCTQSPDYFLPTTACLIQDRLGIPTSAGALDFNLGCSGFVYGLGLAQGLIESGQAANVLLLTAETYSKFIHPRDRSVRTIFGDAAAATLVSAVEADAPLIGPFVFGTDGRGANNLIVPTGGLRRARTAETAREITDDSGSVRTQDHLFMDGAEIFNFTLKAVPQSVCQLLERSRKTLEEIDLFVFHQANRYMLEHLRRKIKVPQDKFCVAMSHCGNTVSSTIPIALKHAQLEGRLKPGDLTMLVGFGVGYSWAAGLARWV